MKCIVLRGKTAGLLAAVFAGLCATGLFWSQRQTLPALSSPRPLPIYSVEREDRAVALGINCAWDNQDIPQLLEALEQAQAKATFFILGEWCEKYPESVRQIAQAGHEIASHSYTHRDMTALSGEEVAQEARRSMEVLEQASGSKPRLIRPPSGAYDDRVIDTIQSLGYTAIQWDVDTLDWKKLTPDEMLLRVTSQTRPGSILLLHSGGEHTAQALPQILSTLRQAGFTFLPVGQLIFEAPYTVDVEGRQHKG